MNTITPGAIATVLDRTGSAHAIITNINPENEEANGFIVRTQDYSDILRPWSGSVSEIIMVEDERGAVLDYPNVHKWVSITTEENGGYFIRSSENHGKRARDINTALTAVVNSLFELNLNREARQIKSNREMYIGYLSAMVE